MVLATLTLDRPQSAVAPRLRACIAARHNLGRQTRGDSNSFSLPRLASSACSLSLSLCVCLCLFPSERIRWGVGWKQYISQASLVWIYSRPYVSPHFLFLSPSLPLPSSLSCVLSLVLLFAVVFTYSRFSFSSQPSLIHTCSTSPHPSVTQLFVVSLWGDFACSSKVIFPEF